MHSPGNDVTIHILNHKTLSAMHVTYEYTCALMHALVCQSIAAGKVVYLDIMTIGCLQG